MKNISGSIFSLALALLLLPSLNGQDTLRTYGPRMGFDLARIAYFFTDPAQQGAEISMDVEIIDNIYPVVELGYGRLSETTQQFSYSSSGFFTRLGVDYNLLPVTDRSVHHAFTVGGRYGFAPFSHSADDALITSAYWGDLMMDPYQSSPVAHWLELAGGLKTEVVANFFLGWSVRYRILLNASMDPLVTPRFIPGYGDGRTNRAFGFSYSLFYKIPLLQR